MQVQEIFSLYFNNKIQDALHVINDYLKTQESFELQLLKATIDLQNRDFDKIEEFLRYNSPEFTNLPIDKRFRLATVFANYHLVQDEFDEFKYYLDKAEELYYVIDDIWHLDYYLAEYFRLQAQWEILNHKFEEARYILETTIQINKEINNFQGLGRNYKNLGVLIAKKANGENPFGYYFDAINIFERIGNDDELVDCYNKIGNMLVVKGNLAHASDYYNYALSLIEENHSLYYFKSVVLVNIGKIAYNHGKLHEAMNYYLEAMSINTELAQTQGMSSIYLCLGRVVRAQGDLENAIEYFTMAKEIEIDELFSLRKILIYNEIIQTYCKLGQVENAKSHVREMTDIVLDRADDQSMLVLTYAKSVIMKASNQIAFQLAARSSFINMFENENLIYELRMESLLHLIELDLMATDNYIPTTRLKLDDLLNLLYKLSQENSLTFYLVHVLIIKARMQNKIGNTAKAEILRTQAELIATENGMYELVMNYHQQYWDELADPNPGYSYDELLRHNLTELISFSI